MPNDKGLLGEEQIKKICADHGWDIAPSELELVGYILQAQLSALSSQPDEKLLERIIALLVLHTKEGDCPCAEHQEQRKRLSKLILSEVATTIAATVEEAYYKGLNRQIDLKLEQARVEERKAIGRKLHDIYDSQPNSFPLVRKAIERLESGEQPGGE